MGFVGGARCALRATQDRPPRAIVRRHEKPPNSWFRRLCGLRKDLLGSQQGDARRFRVLADLVIRRDVHEAGSRVLGDVDGVGKTVAAYNLPLFTRDAAAIVELERDDVVARRVAHDEKHVVVLAEGVPLVFDGPVGRDVLTEVVGVAPVVRVGRGGGRETVYDVVFVPRADAAAVENPFAAFGVGRAVIAALLDVEEVIVHCLPDLPAVGLGGGVGDRRAIGDVARVGEHSTAVTTVGARFAGAGERVVARHDAPRRRAVGRDIYASLSTSIDTNQLKPTPRGIGTPAKNTAVSRLGRFW